MPLWIGRFFVLCVTAIDMIHCVFERSKIERTLNEWCVYPFWLLASHHCDRNFHCGTMRSNCGRTQCIYGLLFSGHHSLGALILWVDFKRSVNHHNAHRARSLSLSLSLALAKIGDRISVSSKIPLRKTFFHTAQFHNDAESFWSSATRSTIHTAWFHSNTCASQKQPFWCQ